MRRYNIQMELTGTYSNLEEYEVYPEYHKVIRSPAIDFSTAFCTGDDITFSNILAKGIFSTKRHTIDSIINNESLHSSLLIIKEGNYNCGSKPEFEQWSHLVEKLLYSLSSEEIQLDLTAVKAKMDSWMEKYTVNLRSNHPDDVFLEMKKNALIRGMNETDAKEHAEHAKNVFYYEGLHHILQKYSSLPDKIIDSDNQDLRCQNESLIALARGEILAHFASMTLMGRPIDENRYPLSIILYHLDKINGQHYVPTKKNEMMQLKEKMERWSEEYQEFEARENIRSTPWFIG